jgi:hypothetical protein
MPRPWLLRRLSFQHRESVLDPGCRDTPTWPVVLAQVQRRGERSNRTEFARVRLPHSYVNPRRANVPDVGKAVADEVHARARCTPAPPKFGADRSASPLGEEPLPQGGIRVRPRPGAEVIDSRIERETDYRRAARPQRLHECPRLVGVDDGVG